LYESGKRSSAWVKHRINKGQEFVIGGYVPGHPLDSIIVGYYDDGKLFFTARFETVLCPALGARWQADLPL
jgi:bifunctional non-homologous end joining protein LigD